MALRLTLKPNERIVVNGTLIRNGGRAGEIIIETHCRMLRESEIIREEEVDTPCKQIWMTVQVLHLADDPSEAHTLLFTQATELMKVMPSAAQYIAAMSSAIEEGHTHKAIKEVKRLVQHERELLEQNMEHSKVA
jgi:flagellar protein FlbT